MNSATKYLLTTEVTFKAGDKSSLIAAWQKTLPENTQLYLSEIGNSLLELHALKNLNELTLLLNGNRFTQLKSKMKHFLQSDLSQELLSFVEDVIPQKNHLPAGTFLQMRHIEVPLRAYDEYDQWRKATIFKHVQQLKNVDSFVAYHSLLSSQPGVMFVSSFSCEPEDYLAGFKNPAYQEIIQQAGDRFIAGGKNGLYTTVYKKI